MRRTSTSSTRAARCRHSTRRPGRASGSRTSCAIAGRRSVGRAPSPRRQAGGLARLRALGAAGTDPGWNGGFEPFPLKPTLVLVGRPNVGKSTLFNRLTRSRDALVANLPGLTRDRHYGQGRMGDKPFIVVDTGGFEPVAAEGIMSEMARQAREAIAEADVVLFIVDGRAGLSPQDKRIAQQLRESGSNVILV